MHLVTPLGDAWMDSTPLVCLVEHHEDELDEYRPQPRGTGRSRYTKRSWIATDAGELRDAMIAAVDEATTGRWRPVVVETTTAALEAHVEGSARADEPGGRVAELDRAAVKSAAALIRSSAAPILYVGGGVLNARATEELLHLAETARLPVVSTLMGKGAFPEDHPLHYGWPGMHRPKWSNLALNRADLIIAAGARFDDRVTGRLDAFAPGARVIHLDADRREIGKIRHADVAVVGDLRATLVLLTEELAATRAGDAPSSPWLEQMDSSRERFPLRYDEESGLLKPQAVVRLLQKRLPDAVFTTGVGQHQCGRCSTSAPSPRPFISSGGAGTMGFGIPAAIGAKAADPSRTVVCIDGDGCFQMTGKELAAAATNELPIIVALINNGYLGMVTQWQDMYFDRRRSQIDLTHDVDYCAIAEALGALGFRVETELRARRRSRSRRVQRSDGGHRLQDRSDRAVLPMILPGGAAADVVAYPEVAASAVQVKVGAAVIERRSDRSQFVPRPSRRKFMLTKEVISVPGLADTQARGFAQVVAAGDFVFVAGQTAIEELVGRIDRLRSTGPPGAREPARGPRGCRVELRSARIDDRVLLERRRHPDVRTSPAGAAGRQPLC